jgi:hypothetical protein
MTDHVDYEIHNVPDHGGGHDLTLTVEGEVVARAHIAASTLADLASIGLDHEAVLATVQTALTNALKTQQQFVVLGPLKQDDTRSLIFSASYAYRLRDEVSVGAVRYDVATGVAGPDAVPAVVRNAMRSAVHQHLTKDAGGPGEAPKKVAQR